MEARLSRAALIVAAAFSLGASHRTTNFIVTAPSQPFARQVAEAAEKYRHDLAIEWLGRPLPRWQQPCPITLQVGPRLGAGGATSFMFRQGRPFGWQMSVQGTPQRILDSVLPHEVTHTIFATHFGCPLPRWADEGACTTVEHSSERQRQQKMLVEFLTTDRGIPFNNMFAMTEYPPDVLPLYAQGYSLARYLIAQGGKPKFVKYVGEGMQSGNWPEATRRHYGHDDLSDLQVTWLSWVRQGSPLQPETGQLAVNPSVDGDRQIAGVAHASATNLDAADHLARTEDAVSLVPVPSVGQSLAGLGGVSGQPRRGGTEDRRADGLALALATGTPPEPARFDSLESAATGPNPARSGALASSGSALQGSWYVRQRDRALRGGSESDSRMASVAPRGTSSGSTLSPGSTTSMSMSRPQPPQQMQQQVLQWDQRAPKPSWQPHAIPSASESPKGTPSHGTPARNDAPLHAGGTVWR